MNKRANGEGSPFKQSGRWLCKITVIDEKGKRKRVHSSGKTQKEAIENAEKIKKSYSLKSFKKITVRAWLGRWLDVYLTARRTTTRETYRSLIKNHINPEIGNLQLSELAPDAAAGLLGLLLEKRSSNTARLVYDILSSALKQAVKSEVVFRNIMQLVDRPKITAINHQILSEAEIRAFLARIKKSKFYPAYLLMIGGGLRRGEALAAKWENLSFQNKTISIVETLVKTSSGALEVNQPKTRQSKRSVVLPGEVMAALEKIPEWKRCGLITASGGKHVHPNLLWADFRKVKADLGIEKLTLHELRHSHSAHLLRLKIPLSDVSRRLGHSTIKTTGDIYAGIVPDSADNSAEAINSVFKEGS